MPNTEIVKNEDAAESAKSNRKDLMKAALIVGVHVVLPVALTAASIIIAKKMEAKD